MHVLETKWTLLTSTSLSPSRSKEHRLQPENGPYLAVFLQFTDHIRWAVLQRIVTVNQVYERCARACGWWFLNKTKPFNLTLTPSLSSSNKREIPNKFDYLNIYIHAFIIYHFRQKTVTKNTFLYTNLLCFSKNIAESIKLRKKYVYFSRPICHRTKKINRIELQHMH